MLLPGTRTIPEQTIANRAAYYAALEEADDAWKEREVVDLSAMEKLIAELLTGQLLSVAELAGTKNGLTDGMQFSSTHRQALKRGSFMTVQLTEGLPPEALNDLGDTLSLLATRRSASAKAMQEPGPSRQQLEQILEIAVRVPDHGKLAPWRFIIFEGDGRTAFGGILEARWRSFIRSMETTAWRRPAGCSSGCRSSSASCRGRRRIPNSRMGAAAVGRRGVPEHPDRGNGNEHRLPVDDRLVRL